MELAKDVKIKFLSDTHCMEFQEKIETVDILVHCGDATNSYDVVDNKKEWFTFWEWFKKYPAEHKIYVPGNHDAFLASSEGEAFMKEHDAQEGESGYHFLIQRGVKIMNIHFWGSPYTPTFGNWYFMKSRSDMYDVWNEMPNNVDILVTHGPPHSALDLVLNRNHSLEFAGDVALRAAVNVNSPKYHAFGHIHSHADFENNGILDRGETIFYNCAQVVDRIRAKGLLYNGKILDWKW